MRIDNRMPSNVEHRFSDVPAVEMERSVFDRTHTHKTTFDGGYLIPFYIDEVLPGDTFNVDATLFGRLNAQMVPIMDNLYLDTFYFFVPNRLLWSNWKKFCGEQEDPTSSISFTVPQIEAPLVTGWVTNSLSDYFGLPIGVAGLSVCAFWHRAYNLIWNEWFRSENLQDSVVVDVDDGPDSSTDYVLLQRGKRHDYFTSCLPWAQKGTGVLLPLGDTAPVLGIGLQSQVYGTAGQNVYETTGSTTYANSKLVQGGAADTNAYIEENPDYAGHPNIFADLTNATASTINSLRQAFQVQKLLERDARGGTRYVELLKSHFNVVSPDFRLQRPEFLGGKSTPVMVKSVEVTTELTRNAGDLAAMVTVASQNDGFVQSFTEHGIIMGLCEVRADLGYQQGLQRMFSRLTRYDFYWPSLAHIGEQAVLNKEIYCAGTADDDEPFGYQERWAEYRYGFSKITGSLRSNVTAPNTTLDYWHLAQDFAALPVLGPSFIVDEPPIARVEAFNGDAGTQVTLDAYLKIKCVRPMPVYSVPGLIDHF